MFFFLFLLIVTATISPDGQYLPGDMIPSASTPEPMTLGTPDGPYVAAGIPQRALAGHGYTTALPHPHSHSEVSGEAW